jgi:hypothetical protein
VRLKAVRLQQEEGFPPELNAREMGVGKSTLSKCVRLRSGRANYVWSYDFVSAMTHDGRSWRLGDTITTTNGPTARSEIEHPPV